MESFTKKVSDNNVDPRKLAFTEKRENVPGYKKSKRRVLTNRGVIWLGQTCNLRCHFCYFLDRINSKFHPEHSFMSIEKAKKICSILVDYYNNKAVDIQGGEPTIYSHIYELVKHCRKIGLLPTLITNALILANPDECKRLKESGVRDLLISIHGLGETFDKIVGVPGAHKKQMIALKNLQELGVPFRFNSVLSKMALPELTKIAELAIQTDARVVNFIAFNPFEDQQKEGKRSSKNVPKYSEVVPFLTDAMDCLNEAGIECNIRYFPICMVEERHRKSVYNFQQLPYDIHEWDFASWSWTGMQPQRMKDGDISPVMSLKEATFCPISYPKLLENILERGRNSLSNFPKLMKIAKAIHKKISIAINNYNIDDKDIENLYRENARLRAREHCHYVYSESCKLCSIQNICDGFHGDYAYIFGTDEAKPIIASSKISDPKYFIVEQEKIVEEEDYEWAL
jgi:MoaA/NifB/PqqE/SkfB family radical SAM enzyme